MIGRKSFLLVFLLALSTSDGFSQSTPPPDPGIGPPPISDIDRLNRQYETLKGRTDTMATLLLSYKSTGELTSSLEKSNPQGLFVRAAVNGTPIKKLAKSGKPTIAEGIEPGPMEVEATWSRPGTRLKTKCEGLLQVGFQQAVIVPYGGTDNFSCEIMPRLLPDETFKGWKSTLQADEARLLADCSSSEAMGSPGFWDCVDRAGLPLPSG